jgi:hypothetical protein
MASVLQEIDNRAVRIVGQALRLPARDWQTKRLPDKQAIDPYKARPRGIAD